MCIQYIYNTYTIHILCIHIIDIIDGRYPPWKIPFLDPSQGDPWFALLLTCCAGLATTIGAAMAGRPKRPP